MYEKEGAKIVTHEQAWEADLVIKVKKNLMKANINISKESNYLGIFTFSIFKRNSRKNARSWCNCD